jgi:nucleoside-diphosphate-sugar epimerase
MRILVTGGTGFVGSRLIPELAQAGHTVLALTRSASSHDRLKALGAIPVDGDLDSCGPLVLPALDAVVHAAAQFRFGGQREAFFRTNVDGTAALLEGARDAGARTFVHISSAGVVMDDHGTPILAADEGAPTYPNSASPYVASKARSEAAVLAADGPGFRTIALRPSAIWGPGDAFSRELPRAIGTGRFSFIDRGAYPFSTCHVDNLVEAVQCALEKGPGGRAYFVNDREATSFREFIGRIAGVKGLPIERVRSIPYPLALVVGRLMELAWAILRREDDPPLTRAMARMIGRTFTTSDTAARRDLGYVGRTTTIEGVRRYAATAA